MQFRISECGKLKDGEIKATLLQGTGLYIAKIQRPVFDKDAESKKCGKPNYYYILEQLHNNQKKIMRKKNKLERPRVLTLCLKLN